MYNTEKMDGVFESKRFESDGEIILHGEKIPYHTVCEDNVFYEDGKAIASIFSYSYFRSDVKDNKDRPVIFAFNGGPGSSSMYVHAGFFGAKRIKYDEVDRETSLPPYEVIDNPDCLLDVADVVCVDPVGTGFGLLIDETKGKKFFGIDEDAEALVSFVEMWLRRYNRFNSPKYLAGESYGCTRSAVAAGITCGGFGKERGYGIKFDGIIFIGNTVTIGKYFNQGVPVENSVQYFPTYAAINWYHNHPSSQSVDDFAYEAKAFADSEYLLALYKGEALKGEEREDIIKKVMYYTGVSREFLEERALKIDEFGFRKEVIKHKGLSVSRYDGRVTRPLINPFFDEEKEGAWRDATAQRYDGFFYGALNGTILPSLNVKLDRQYLTFRVFEDEGPEKTWNTEEKNGTTAERLREAMNGSFGMRVFFANGWYDDCTEIGMAFYTIDHAGLDHDRVFIKPYKSGHMIYISEENS
ncbi:MAG: hypothetical protein Q4D13_07795, partial [Erysipelotrichaceae bacterium]|nr:hypothetical protein [Erysipelotrichaceae bacterium]